MMSGESAGQVITFYSYKGGTGRSMALANVACLLARRESSKSVLMLDWDLEAPGLHRYFRFDTQRQTPFEQKPGLIDLFHELSETILRNFAIDGRKQTEDEARELMEKIGIERFISDTGIPSLSLLKAGQFDQDGQSDDEYSTKVNTFDWEELYERSPHLLRAFAELLVERYHYVLIDSRTGVTDISGICTMIMPDKLVVVFTPNRQSLSGVIGLIERAISYRRRSDDLRSLTVFPLASRIEPARPSLRNDWRYGNPDKGIPGFQRLFEELFRQIYELPKPECELEEYFDEVQIQHVPDYAYGEEIAVVSEHTTDRLSLSRSYESFIHRLLDFSTPWDKLETEQTETQEETTEENVLGRIRELSQRGKAAELMVLAEEAQTRSLKIEAHRAAATALMRYERFAMSLSQCEMAIAIDPMDLSCLRMKGLLLIKLNRLLEAYRWLKDLTKRFSDDTEICGLLGLARKEQWISAWREPGKSVEEMRESAAFEEELLQQAMDAYERGFSIKKYDDLYLGVNLLTLALLHKHLIGDADNHHLDSIATQVRLFLRHHHVDDYLSQALIADFVVLTGAPKGAEKAYKAAVTFAEDNWLALESSRQNLLILKDLGFNPENVEAALKVLDRALIKIKSANASLTPRKVFLFSGHAIDSPGRPEPRFPAIMEATAKMAIEEKLNELGAGPDDLALCAGSCGGDLLFAEACLQRGLRLELRIPYEVSAFITSSVGWAGEQWVTRFYNVRNHPRTTLFTMPDELGQAPVSVYLWERNNLWQLYSALTLDAENVAFICLWNRQPSDGRGGVSHMHDLALNHSIDIHVLNIFNNYADAE